MKLFLSISILIFQLFCTSNAGNILILPSMVSPSHKMGMLPLADALAERGHKVLFWAPISIEDSYIPKKASWKQIRAHSDDKWVKDFFIYQNDSGVSTLLWEQSLTVPAIESLITYWTLPFCENILKEKKQDFMEVLSQKWDLIIIDELFNPCGYLLTQFAKAPVITYVSTLCMTHTATNRNGQPAPRSYVPYCTNLDGYGERMTFLQRAVNTFMWTASYAVDKIAYFLITRRLRAFYPETTDIINGLIKPDLIFFYFYKPMDFAVPQLPNVVHMGGLHVQSALKPIPESVQKAVDSGAKGFLMVSTGHMLRFEKAPPEIRKAFLEAFRRVAADGFSIIWSYTADQGEVLPHGVYGFKWLPQRELLAHPKCRGFLSHCGCNSASESILNGVPMVGLGMFADQINGAVLFEAKGICVRLNKQRLSSDIIYDTVIRVVSNDSMQSRAKLFAKMVTDEPVDALEKAVFWSEHIIRHKGGKWLRSKLPPNYSSPIKYYCIDVISVMMGILIVILYIAFQLLKLCWKLVVGDKMKNN